jgi:nucleoside-diphosphate-sugar epimerase
VTIAHQKELFLISKFCKMSNTILVAGATGNLGGKIVNALIKKDAKVIAVVRLETNPEKIKMLENKGVSVFQVDMANKDAIAKVCQGVDCVVSALSGLRETIIDTQKILLDAAIDAKVPRFIPSDYSIDFTNLINGTNRNLDLRREFHQYLDKTPIKATTIFNGPFMDLLTGDMPLILLKINRILYWGKPNQNLDFTTTYDVAKFTANAALDNNTPRYLCIAGDSITPSELVNVMSNLTGKPFRLLKAGSIGLLNIIIKIAKTLTPKSDELYPVWQGMQYMRDMMEGRAKVISYDNKRYTDINWTTVKQFLVEEKVDK